MNYKLVAFAFPEIKFEKLKEKFQKVINKLFLTIYSRFISRNMAYFWGKVYITTINKLKFLRRKHLMNTNPIGNYYKSQTRVWLPVTF